MTFIVGSVYYSYLSLGLVPNGTGLGFTTPTTEGNHMDYDNWEPEWEMTLDELEGEQDEDDQDYGPGSETDRDYREERVRSCQYMQKGRR